MGIIDKSRLMEVLSYDKDSGVFTWIKGPRRGKQAGCFRSDGYLMLRIDRILYYGHRLAWLYSNGVIQEEIDHINGNSSDNRLCNLRAASSQQNKANSAKKSATGLPKGVMQFKGKFRAQIMVNYRHFHLGDFDTPDEAARAYQIAAQKYQGEFALHNSRRVA